MSEDKKTSTTFVIKRGSRGFDINVVEFCAAVKAERTLWRIDCRNFRNQQARLECWRRVAAKVCPFFSTISSWNLEDQHDIAKQFQVKFRRLRDQVVRVKKTNSCRSYYLWNDLEFVLENMKGWLPETPQNTEEDNTTDVEENEEESFCGFVEEVLKPPATTTKTATNDMVVQEDVRPTTLNSSLVSSTHKECIPPNEDMCQRWKDSIQKCLEAMPIDQMTWSIDLMYDVMYNVEIKNSKTNLMNIQTVSSFAPTINNTSFNCLKAIHTNFLGILQRTLDKWVEEKSKVAVEKFNLFRYICKMGMEGRLCKDTTFTENSSILDCSTISMSFIDESSCENT